MIEQLGPESKSTKQNQASGPSHRPTFYEILDVSTQASRLQIREAYIRLKSTYSSGSAALYSLVSEDEARATLDSMEEAYRVLDDEMQRKEYDESIGLQRESPRGLAADLFSGQVGQEGPRSSSNRNRSSVTAEPEVTTAFKTSRAPLVDSWETLEPRPVSRRLSTLSKIRKFAARAFDGDVRSQGAALLANGAAFDGVTLTTLRELMAVPQSEVQERTKIAIEYIKALENNDFQKLPSVVYVRGFLKIYLQYLGVQDLEAKPLIEAYTEKYNNWREKHRPNS